MATTKQRRKIGSGRQRYPSDKEVEQHNLTHLAIDHSVQFASWQKEERVHKSLHRTDRK